jgi:hypothetical protein
MPGRSSAGSGRAPSSERLALTSTTPTDGDRSPRPGTPQLMQRCAPGVSAGTAWCRVANSAVTDGSVPFPVGGSGATGVGAPVLFCPGGGWPR